MIAVGPMKEVCGLKFLDVVVFIRLNVVSPLPQQEPRRRKTFGVAPYRVQVRWIGEIVVVARPSTIIIREKDYSFAAVYQDPPGKVNCRNRIQLTKQENLARKDSSHQESELYHKGTKPAALDGRESAHMVLPAKIQIFVSDRRVSLVAARRFRSRGLAA